jgi:hypothetical protein
MKDYAQITKNFQTLNCETNNISSPKSSNFPLFSNRKEAKNFSTGIETGSFETDDPNRTKLETPSQ